MCKYINVHNLQRLNFVRQEGKLESFSCVSRIASRGLKAVQEGLTNQNLQDKKSLDLTVLNLRVEIFKYSYEIKVADVGNLMLMSEQWNLRVKKFQLWAVVWFII